MKPIDANAWARVKDEIRREAASMRERTPHPTLPKSHPRPRRRIDSGYGRSEYTIDELARFPYTTFVDQAFRAVLKRPPDPAGFDAHVRGLIAGGSKIEVLGNLRYSGEGRRAAVHIRGLLPRYALAKLFRIPVLGYLAEWVVALAGLPKIVRQQRAMDTMHYARSFEIDTAGRKLAEEVGTLRDSAERLVAEIALAQHRASHRISALQETWRAELDGVQARAQDSHLVLSMNHWLNEFRRSLSALEAEEAAQRTKARSLIDGIIGGDALKSSRASRLDAWAIQLTDRMPRGARVLDLDGDEEWFAHLERRGIGIQRVAECIDAIGGDDMSAGWVPAEVRFDRIADATIDAVTALAVSATLRRLPGAALFSAARRVLRPGGVLMLGFDSNRGEIVDRLSGTGGGAIDGHLLGSILAAAGFIDIRDSAAPDGTACLIASTPS